MAASTCVKCNAEMELDGQDDRRPCPACGSTARRIPVDAGTTINLSEIQPKQRAELDQAINALSGAHRLSDEVAKLRASLDAGTKLVDMTQLDSMSAQLARLRSSFSPDYGVVQALKLEESYRQQELQAARMLGNFDAQFRKAALDPFNDLALAKKLLNDQFRSPAAGEIARLMDELKRNSAAELIREAKGMQASLQEMMAAIRSPFLDIQEAAKSASAIAELHGIANAIKTSAPFDDALSDALRADFGDWRDQVNWSMHNLNTLEGRLDLYVSQGFDTDLVAIPSPAFDQVLDLAGYTQGEPSFEEQFGPPIAPPDREEGEAIERTNVGHRWLVMFERQLRSFIDDVMTETIGPGWETKRVESRLVEEWVNRRETEIRNGRDPQPLIAYADFTDYERIICRKDNWVAFKGFFRRQQNVQESLQRLYPVRLATMHSRLLTQEDQILMYAEIKRLGKVLRRQ